MRRILAVLFLVSLAPFAGAQDKERKYLDPIDVKMPHISTDKTVKIDYDIVYVRARRAGDKVHKRFYTDFSSPVTLEPGADLMLLHPDGNEELLVAGGDGSVTDPIVSFDGEWVYYTHIHDLKKASQWTPPRQGADIYKIHVPSAKDRPPDEPEVLAEHRRRATGRRTIRTPENGQERTSNTASTTWGPVRCPAAGSSSPATATASARPRAIPPCSATLRHGRRTPTSATTTTPPNLDKIGHLNLAGALHPVVLKDGRIMYSSLESQGLRGDILWGIWTIHPDGTDLGPARQRLRSGRRSQRLPLPDAAVRRRRSSSRSITTRTTAALALTSSCRRRRRRLSRLRPGLHERPAQPAVAHGPARQRPPRQYRMPFMPTGSMSLTPFAHGAGGPGRPLRCSRTRTSPAVGKFTHPSAAPDNHLLTVWSPGPVNHQYTFLPQLDGGIYLIKSGKLVDEPGQMLLIKNDPEVQRMLAAGRWCPTSASTASRSPETLPRLANDGKLSTHLPEGTPFGLVGTSSFYKRESLPQRRRAEGRRDGDLLPGGNDRWKGLDPFTSHGNGMPLNWHNQGADAGLYSNDDIHAIRILVDGADDRSQAGPSAGRRFYNHANERLRILGEIPLRKFRRAGSVSNRRQPLDPDGNPDTSFLAKIPADIAFTFQTLDKDGMVLNMAQTWHQLRPGEIRNNCGGCHAHSQKPTPFEKTAAGEAEATRSGTWSTRRRS